MTITRILRRRALGAGLAAIAATLGPAPLAHAEIDDDARLVLSVDGSAWVSDVLTPMFEASHVWTAGDSGTYSVLFRNDSGEPAQAFAEFVLEGPAAEVLEARLRMDDEPWALGPTSSVIDVAAGQVVQLDLELTIPSTAASVRTALGAEVSAIVTLRGEVPETGPDGDADANADGLSSVGTGILAATGSSVALFVALGLLLAGVGGWLVARVRRQRRSQPAGEDMPGASGTLDDANRSSSLTSRGAS